MCDKTFHVFLCPLATDHGDTTARKPSLEVAPTTLAAFLADGEFSTDCYFIYISTSGLLSMHGR